MTNIVAVELSRTGIRAVEVTRAGSSKPVIQRFGQIALPEDAVFDGEVQHQNEVANALKKLWRKAKFSSKTVMLGLGNRKLLMREATLPVIPGGYNHDTLSFQVRDIISTPVETTVLDFFPLRAEMIEDSETTRVSPGQEGLLIAAPKESILTTAATFTKAGLTLRAIDVTAFALTRGLAPDDAGTTVILNIGANTTHIIIVQSGVPRFVRVIPNGGDDITRAIMQQHDMSFAKAEALKIRLGLYAVQGDKVEIEAENLIRENVASLLGNVQNTVNYFASRGADEHVGRIILAGGASRLGGLPTVIEDVTKLPVELANPFANFGFAGRVNQKTLTELGPELASVLGLTIGGNK